MPNRNPFGLALDIARAKYADNAVISALVCKYQICQQSIEVSQTTARIISASERFADYRRGIDGEDGYSGMISIEPRLFNDTLSAATQFLQATRVGECLIVALQALGEEIEY